MGMTSPAPQMWHHRWGAVIARVFSSTRELNIHCGAGA